MPTHEQQPQNLGSKSSMSPTCILAVRNSSILGPDGRIWRRICGKLEIIVGEEEEEKEGEEDSILVVRSLENEVIKGNNFSAMNGRGDEGYKGGNDRNASMESSRDNNVGIIDTATKLDAFRAFLHSQAGSQGDFRALSAARLAIWEIQFATVDDNNKKDEVPAASPTTWSKTHLAAKRVLIMDEIVMRMDICEQCVTATKDSLCVRCGKMYRRWLPLMSDKERAAAEERCEAGKKKLARTDNLEVPAVMGGSDCAGGEETGMEQEVCETPERRIEEVERERWKRERRDSKTCSKVQKLDSSRESSAYQNRFDASFEAESPMRQAIFNKPRSKIEKMEMERYQRERWNMMAFRKLRMPRRHSPQLEGIVENTTINEDAKWKEEKPTKSTIESCKAITSGKSKAVITVEDAGWVAQKVPRLWHMLILCLVLYWRKQQHQDLRM